MKALIIGGTKYFGKKVVDRFLHAGDEVTLLTRGLAKDAFGSRVKRLISDRRDKGKLKQITNGLGWDVILDQRCMNAHDAKIAVDIFNGKTGHYVFTSSQSVYDPDQEIKESEFVPDDYSYGEFADENKNYKEAKRQAEVVFIKTNAFEMSIVRPPIVLGPDDYTERLKFHVDRVIKGEQIFFPRLDAKISFINSDDAAEALFKICKLKTGVGPINIASRDPVKLSDLMSLISKATDKLPNYNNKGTDESWSPFGIEADWYADVHKASSLGITSTDIQSWLPNLVLELVKNFRTQE